MNSLLLAGALMLASAQAAAQPPSLAGFPAVEAQGVESARGAAEHRRVVITHVLVDGEVLPFAGGAVILPRGHRNLEVRYRLDGAPGPFRYRFRLEPVDAEWAEVERREAAYYRNLAAGTFTFRVQALSAEAGWEYEAALGVHVEPFPHETLAFRALLGVLALALALGGLRLRTRGLSRRAGGLAALVAEQTAAFRAEKERAEAALAEAEAEREAARTARAAAEEQAAALQRAAGLQTRFFANISHEVRTPLTLVLGALEEAASGALGAVPDPLHAALVQAARNGRRVERLVDEMLSLARLDAGRFALHPRPHGLAALVRDVVHAFRTLAGRGGVTLTFSADVPEALRVLADRPRLEQILFNLLSNALKATPAGGKVAVHLAAAAEPGRANGTDGEPAGGPARTVFAEVRVQDTGPGIAPDALPHVFDRFFQADVPDSPARGGAGLGLSLARGLARRHGGDLEAASVPGFGSTFTLRLRLDEAPPASSEAEDGEDADGEGVDGEAADGGPFAARLEDEEARPPSGDGASGVPALAPAAAEGPSARPLVLVAEDNPEVAFLIQRQLRAEFRVRAVSDGAAGLAAARAHRPALILSDVVMPGGDGLAFLRAVREDPALADVPFVLLSALATPEDREAGLALGADDYVVKPFHAAELRARLRGLVRTRRTLLDRYGTRVAVGKALAPVASTDARFLERVHEVITERLADEAFSVEALAREAGVSQAQLKRKLRALADTTPVELVRTRRLDRAAELLAGGAGNVGEVAAAVGFGSASYFARCFRDRFGMAPSAYRPRP